MKHYIQLDAMDCGPTCLRMIAHHYGKHFMGQTLRERCYMTREGVSMLSISEAAEAIGFRTNGVRISFNQLVNEAILPCILHWNQNHFVVCYKIKKHRNGNYDIYIADPASQNIKYSKDEFLKCWLSTKKNDDEMGIALLLEPGTDFYNFDDDKKEYNCSAKYFLRYFFPYKKQLVQLFIGLVVGNGLQMIFPFLTQSMVDIGIYDNNLSFITIILLTQLLLFIAQLGIEFIQGWILLHVNSRIDIALISDFLMKLMKLPLRYFDSKNTGDIMQRIGDHGRIKSFLMGNSISMIFSFVNFFVFGTILGYYQPLILGIFLLGNILYVIWILAFMKYRRELDIKRFNQSSTEQSKIIQLIQGMQEIKLNNCERQKRWEWEQIQAKLFKIGVRGLGLGQIQQSGSFFFTQTTNLIISYIAAKSVIEGNMTMGMMMSLTYIIGQVGAPINNFVGFAQAFQDAQISMERLNEIHGLDDEVYDNCKINQLPENRTIHIENVSFSYSGAERDYVLNNLTLTIPQNKITAIVGASGSGKTTLLKLLQGFYEPNKGRIRIGETLLNTINPHLWRSCIGAVMQDGYIFSDTIVRNIAISGHDVDKKHLLNAVKIANIQEYINALPLGYDTKIGMEGNGMSQGQKQRILIARVVYKNPEYIFLDEATNSLDTHNERVIMDNLQKFFNGKTVVVIAHRLSTVKNANNIIVLDKGNVVEEGTHQQLLDKHGVYYSLIKNQLEA